MHLSAVNDSFLSAGTDGTVRLWDLRSSNCQGALNVAPGNAPVANFDPEGLLFAAGINSKQIKLYDARKFEQGPFATFDKPSFLPEGVQGAWTCECPRRRAPVDVIN